MECLLNVYSLFLLYKIDDACSLTIQNCCRIATLSPIHGYVSFSILCFTISEVFVLNLSCCIVVFRLRIICLCKWKMQSGESDSTVYYSCDDRFSQGDNDMETDQVLGNRQDFTSTEGTLDREVFGGGVHLLQQQSGKLWGTWKRSWPSTWKRRDMKLWGTWKSLKWCSMVWTAITHYFACLIAAISLLLLYLHEYYIIFIIKTFLGFLIL